MNLSKLHQRDHEIKENKHDPRHVNASFREIKLAPSETGVMQFSGYASVFDNVDAYGDVIVKGAFSQTIADIKAGKQNWPVMLSQHGGWVSASDNVPIGIWVDFTEDDIGLKVEGKLAETPRGREYYDLMKMQPRPAIDGMSIGFYVKEQEYGSKPGEPDRIIKRVELVEISLVTFPANDKARVQDIKSKPDTERKFQEQLQELGFTRSEAIKIINQGFKSLKSINSADDVDIINHDSSNDFMKFKQAIEKRTSLFP